MERIGSGILLLSIGILFFLCGIFVYKIANPRSSGRSIESINKSINNSHYIGKMDYYLSMEEVFIDYDIRIPDSIMFKIEKRYKDRSISNNFIPYPK